MRDLRRIVLWGVLIVGGVIAVQWILKNIPTLRRVFGSDESFSKSPSPTTNIGGSTAARPVREEFQNEAEQRTVIAEKFQNQNVPQTVTEKVAVKVQLPPVVLQAPVTSSAVVESAQILKDSSKPVINKPTVSENKVGVFIQNLSLKVAAPSVGVPLSKWRYLSAVAVCLSTLALITWSLYGSTPETYQNSLPYVLTGVLLFNLAAIYIEWNLKSSNKPNGEVALSSPSPVETSKVEQGRLVDEIYSRSLYQLLRLPFTGTKKIADGFFGWLRISPLQFILLIGALVASVLVYGNATDAEAALRPSVAVFLWLLAIVWVVVGSWDSKSGDTSMLPKWTWWEVGVLVGLVALAFGLRYYDTTHIPFMLGGDEGAIGLASVPFANGQANNIFNATLASPSLYFYMQGLAIHTWGQTVAALRFSSVIAGTLSVLATYWLARSMFGRTAAIFSAAYMAAFHFNIHFSRIALQNIWEALYSAAVMGALWNGWITGRRSRFILFGLTAGLAQYFFPGVRLILFVIPIWLGLAFFVDRKRFWARIPDFLIALIAMLVVFMPLLNYYIQHPEIYTEPLPRSFILSPAGPAHDHVFGGGASLVEVLTSQFSKAILGYTYIPVTDWYTPGKPLLLALPGALFLIAVVYAFFRIKNLRYSLLLLMILADFVFGIALTTNPPTSQRMLMAIPCVVVLLALIAERFVHWTQQIDPGWVRPALALTTVLIIAAMVVDINFYFNIYTPSKIFRDANDEIANDIANYVDTLAPLGEGWHILCVCPPRMGYHTHPQIEFLAPNATGDEFIDPLTAIPQLANTGPVLAGPTLFVFLPERRSELDVVQSAFPGGQITDEYYRDGKLLYTFYQTVVP
jgi:Dolichyl-phosphate-mannose-protein mannosyltransferase